MALRLRLFLAVILAVAVAIGWLVWWEVEALRPRAWGTIEESLADSAGVLAAVVAEHSTGADPEVGWLARAWAQARTRPVQALIYDVLKNDLAMEVSVTDRRGICRYDSAEPANQGRDNSQWNDVLRTLRGGYGARSTPAIDGDPRSIRLHVAAPITRTADDGSAELIGVLSLSKPIAVAVPMARVHRLQLVLAALAIGGATGLVALFVTAWITSPLAQLTAHVRRAAQGRRERLSDLGRGEVGDLARALTELQERLEGRAYAETYVEHLTHELKSPLAGIRASAELLGDDLPMADRTRFAATLQAELARATTIIERLLQLASLEHRVELERREPVDLAALVVEIRDALVPRTGCHRQSIALTGNASTAGDRFLLRQAVTNLIENALDASPDGAAVEAMVEHTASTVWIRIRDHGAGIPEFALSRLGERFYTLPKPSTGRKGTGLGLAFVREVARLHGGTVVIGNHPGGGTEAVLRLSSS